VQGCLVQEAVMRGVFRFTFLTSPLWLSACAALAFFQLPVDPAGRHAIPDFVVPAVVPGVAYERFMVIGDMGTGTPDQYEVAAAMTKRAEREGLDFILTVGDNFYPNGVQSADDPQWKTKFENVYSSPVLQVPVFASLGNHDHYGNPAAQVAYAQKNPRWRMPAQYYSFTRTLADGVSVQFFAVDTDPITREHPKAKQQLEWLAAELAKSDARWKIVYGHHPVYSHGPHGDTRLLVENLEPILVEHKVDLFLAGHDHTLEMLKPVRGIHYVISGAAGGPDKAYVVEWSEESYYAATLGGFVLCRVSKDELVIEFVRLNGNTQYAHTLRKAG
jgi:acid phosphatase